MIYNSYTFFSLIISTIFNIVSFATNYICIRIFYTLALFYQPDSITHKYCLMQAKLIEYAYPTSDTAREAGMYETGCWTVTVYSSVNSCNRVKELTHLLKKQEAIAYAEALPLPYNWMHKYFNY